MNRTQSKRSAEFGDVRQSRQRLDCGRFSAAFPSFEQSECFDLFATINFRHFQNMIPDSYIPSNPEPHPPDTFKLPSVCLADLKFQMPPKDWPHAPVHRLADNAVYFVTASTLHKQHLFDTPEKRDFLELHLLALAKRCGWQLEAWAVFANHYHIVTRGNHDSRNLGEFLHDLHGVSSRELNKLDESKAGKCGSISATPS